MPSIVVFAGVMVVLLFSAVIWINVKYFRQEKQKEYRETLGQEEVTDPACEQIVIDETLVPLFTNENWKRVFYRLEKTPELLGWIAFQNQIVGAGDRVYDKDFVGALLSHHDAVKKVQIAKVNVQDLITEIHQTLLSHI